MRGTSTNVLAQYFITTLDALKQWLDGRYTHLAGLCSPKNS
jgi:hypothetical protein